MIHWVPNYNIDFSSSSCQKSTREQTQQRNIQIDPSFANLSFYEYLILNLVKENFQIKQQITHLKQEFMGHQLSCRVVQPDNLILKTERCKRKYRKNDNDLERKFICPHEKCKRSYSWKIALNSHIRKKHAKTDVYSVENVIEQ